MNHIGDTEREFICVRKSNNRFGALMRNKKRTENILLISSF